MVWRAVLCMKWKQSNPFSARILNVSTPSSWLPLPFFGPYGSSKAALSVHLSLSLSLFSLSAIT
jgi:NAD(P)-dependent dehydrogenase (short-subunit alcohol dehydrogenase family)